MTFFIQHKVVSDTEPFPMKRELKDLLGYQGLNDSLGYRTIPYEEGTERWVMLIEEPAHAVDTEPFPMKRELKEKSNLSTSVVIRIQNHSL